MTSPFKTTPTTVHDHSIWVGGNFVDLTNPNPSEIHLEDIARALSRIARFGGHTTHFYSVAEHCVNCLTAFSMHAAGNIFTDPYLNGIARDILLHDAAEAYLGDVTSPLKAVLPEYRRLEARMHAAIMARFELSGEAQEWVKRVDLEMLALEKHELLPLSPPWPVTDGVALLDIKIECHAPDTAERNFLMMAEDLGLLPHEFGRRSHAAIVQPLTVAGK